MSIKTESEEFIRLNPGLTLIDVKNGRPITLPKILRSSREHTNSYGEKVNVGDLVACGSKYFTRYGICVGFTNKGSVRIIPFADDGNIPSINIYNTAAELYKSCIKINNNHEILYA